MIEDERTRKTKKAKGKTRTSSKGQARERKARERHTRVAEEKVKSFGMKIVKDFEAFERFADRHGSDGEELDKFVGGEKKKKGKKKK
ncbi:MAG: hypothetical protein JRI44_14060 [Deltaproteobacteria bacterium]|nr:hypothetical protein [Deltaproteobacteria bacterium]